ncbi:MAG: radical SAM family heme chaperone HemW [Rikenellaceae bacterium]
MAGIYLHIPFCKRLCGYCDFFKSVHTSRLDDVVERMCCEIEEQRDFLHDKSIETIYFGGGTPSLLSVSQVERLLGKCGENFDLSSLEEVTFEANPDDLTQEYLNSIINIGINRLSLGVQSFDDELLRFMNRRHSSAQAQRAVEMARRAGFDNITIDLIFGIDGYPISTLERSVDRALALGVEHISAYHLTIESGTEFARRLSKGELKQCSESQSEEEYMLLHDRLIEAGYEHYEISNYALPGRLSKHNSSYWRGVEYLGVGAGAHGYNGDVRRAACCSIEEYLRGGDQVYEVEKLTLEARYNEYVMTSLRWREGVDIEYLKKCFGEELTHYFTEGITPFVRRGDMYLDRNSIKIDAKSYLMSDFIIEALLVV